MTSNVKPTPGPWYVPSHAPWSVWMDGDRGQIASCRWTEADGKLGPNCIKHYDQSQANARLIAEAGTVYHETGLSPRQLAKQRAELLAALETMKNDHANYVYQMGDGRVRRALEDVYRIAHAAIAKAKGGA